MSSGSRGVRDRRAQRGRRDVETRRTRCETFLITSEGERTEPNYFRGLVSARTGRDKNREDIFPVLDVIGSHAKALRYASRIRATYGEGSVPSKCNPCTTVDELVRKLDEELARSGLAD